MGVIKECRCCGMLLEYPDGLQVYNCPACGTPNERPKSEGLVLNNFRNAIRLQMAREFERAAASYDMVFNAEPDNAEALWGRLLCYYGAVFVNDGGKRRYEIHMPRPKPLREQDDFLRACELAEPSVRAQYERDAVYIDKANARIIELAEKKPPFDIFLCHKTTLPEGGYTEDYNRAYALYNLLSKKGYRVFFAPVEMEGVSAGEDYEAAIYHALDTSRVMLVVCSDPECVSSTWVQSEWSRYLEKIDAGQNKHLIPLLYGGMKAHALPRAFHTRNLQAITMELDGKKTLLKVVGKYARPRKGGFLPLTLLLALVMLIAGVYVYDAVRKDEWPPAWLEGLSTLDIARVFVPEDPADADAVEKAAECRHSYNTQGVCTKCGETCHHSYTTQVDGVSYSSKNATNHTVKTTYVKICAVCGYETNGGSDTSNERHTLNAAGACTKCSYQCQHNLNSSGACTKCDYQCPHSSITTRLEDVSYTQKDATYHTVKTTYVKICADCGSETNGGSETLYERHELSATGRCVACGYQKQSSSFQTKMNSAQTQRLSIRQTVPVYSGPGTNYYRAANGLAECSLHDAFDVFGYENGWYMISYGTNNGAYRIGYVNKSQVQGSISASGLNFAKQAAKTTKSVNVTDDPDARQATIATLSSNTSVTYLATYGNWYYIECKVNGKPMRGFIPSGTLKAD